MFPVRLQVGLLSIYGMEMQENQPIRFPNSQQTAAILRNNKPIQRSICPSTLAKSDETNESTDIAQDAITGPLLYDVDNLSNNLINNANARLI